MTQQETGERTRGQTKVGTVAAVCLRKEKGIPKYPQSEVTIGEYGVEGDYHAGPMRTRSDGQVVPNTRHVTLVAKEVFDDLNRELDTDIPAGGFGSDLSDIREGAVLAFSSGVELEVTGQNDPCKNLMVYHNQVPKRAYGRRGLLAVVRSMGHLKPGDSITVQS